MEWKTAETYAKMARVGEPFEENGKMYINVKEPCGKCGGSGLIPWSRLDNGVCWWCFGGGFRTHKARLYDEKQYAQMQRAKETAAARKEAEKLAKADGVRADWMEWNHFNAEGITWIALGNTYPIKDALKEAGYKFSSEFRCWMGSFPVELEAADDWKIVCFDFEELAESNEYGYCHWKKDAIDIIKAQAPAPKPSLSEYMGEIKERLRDLKAVLVSAHGFESAYGYNFAYTFKVGENVLTWFTAKDLELQPGAEVSLTGTVKKFDEYKGTKQTVLSRCVVKPFC